MRIKSVPMWFKSFGNEQRNRTFHGSPPNFSAGKIKSEQYGFLPYNSQLATENFDSIWRCFPSSLPAPIPPELPSSASRWCFHAFHLCQMLPSHEEPHVGWLGWYVQYHPGVPQRQKSRRLPQRRERQGVTWWGTLRVLTAGGGFTTVLSNETAVAIGKGFDLTFTWGSRSWVHQSSHLVNAQHRKQIQSHRRINAIVDLLKRMCLECLNVREEIHEQDVSFIQKNHLSESRLIHHSDRPHPFKLPPKKAPKFSREIFPVFVARAIEPGVIDHMLWATTPSSTTAESSGFRRAGRVYLVGGSKLGSDSLFALSSVKTLQTFKHQDANNLNHDITNAY